MARRVKICHCQRWRRSIGSKSCKHPLQPRNPAGSLGKCKNKHWGGYSNVSGICSTKGRFRKYWWDRQNSRHYRRPHWANWSQQRDCRVSQYSPVLVRGRWRRPVKRIGWTWDFRLFENAATTTISLGWLWISITTAVTSSSASEQLESHWRPVSVTRVGIFDTIGKPAIPPVRVCVIQTLDSIQIINAYRDSEELATYHMANRVCVLVVRRDWKKEWTLLLLKILGKTTVFSSFKRIWGSLSIFWYLWATRLCSVKYPKQTRRLS